jgi:ATP-dependent DNA ligase
VVSEKKRFETFLKFKMAATAGHRLTLDPMGKCSNAFFSETTNMIKAKLNMNVHWEFSIVIKKQKLCRGLPMIIPGQFGFNCPSGFREEAF